MGKIVVVNDLMQKRYRYELAARPGQDFDVRFKPQLTPAQLLALGIFGGKYMTDCRKEFPATWFNGAKFKPEFHDPAINCFGVLAGQPLSVWRKNGWILASDPRGWFQWYCRYYLGRRIPAEDNIQIQRWLAIRRHLSQLQKHCATGDVTCRPKQRQALLQWAYDSRKL